MIRTYSSVRSHVSIRDAKRPACRSTRIRTVGLIWFAGAIPLTIAYWQNGVLNATTAPLSAYACIPGMIGIWIGELVRDRIPQETFRKVMLAALVIIGLNLIRRAVFS